MKRNSRNAAADAHDALAPSLIDRILLRLGVRPRKVGHATLVALVTAYVRQVPWESAFRIARKDAAPSGAVAARRPATFWLDAIERGGGGTCFESNYAFFALLRALGYGGYLTINDMGESVACHTAIVVDVAGERYLTDVGLPLHRPLLLRPQVTRSRGPFHTYVARPLASNVYAIERTRHPKRYAFTLRDTPVADGDYYAASSADYGETGLFLDRVIINKVIGERVWRFSSGERPYRLEAFSRSGEREEIPIEERAIVATLADRFGMDAAVLAQALTAVSAPYG